MSNQNETEPIDINLSSKGIDETILSNVLSQINNKQNVVSLNISNNSLHSLPNESVLSQFPNIEHLDVTNNPFNRNFRSLSFYLLSLKNLSSLNIDIKNEDDLKIIINSLPNLKLLNGEEVEFSKEFLPSFEKEKTKLLIYVQKIINFIKHDVPKLEKLKNEFYFLLSENIKSVNHNSKSSAVSYSLSLHKGIYEIYSYLYSYIVDNILLNSSINSKILLGDKDFQNIINEIKHTCHHYQEMIFNLSKGAVVSAGKCFEYYEDVIQEKNNEIDALKQESLRKDRIEKENQRYLTENKFLYEKIQKEKEENELVMNKVIDKVNEFCDINQNTENHSGDFNCYYNTYRPLNTLSTLPSEKKRFITQDKGIKVKVLQETLYKQLSLYSLLEIINEVYKSKEVQNVKNSQAHLPQETLEQHLYTYLNHKYGLKNIIIEKAYKIIGAIKNFALTNSRVCLFGKMLRNEIDEGSIEIVNKLHSSLYNLVCSCRQTKSVDIATLIIDKELINFIGKTLYEHSTTERNLYKNKIDRIIKQDNILTFNQLFNIILEIHIISRTNYLKPFRGIFLKYDTDSNGIVDHNQAKELFASIYKKIQVYLKNGLKEEDFITYLFSQIDKERIGSLTYSNIVKYLGTTNSYIKNIKSKDYSILDLLALN